MQPRAKSSPLKRFLVLSGALAIAGCSCDEPQTFTPAGKYEPDKVLDFGKVGVNTERTLIVKVVSSGGGPLIISATNLNGPDASTAKFTVVPNANLTQEMNGLAPGRTSSITITYRPCPAVWDNNMVKAMPDLSATNCPLAPDTVDLHIVDNSKGGGVTITLSGQPAAPPSVDLGCPQGEAMDAQCHDANPMWQVPACVTLRFGTVNASGPACDLILELRNKLRGGGATGDLTINKLDIIVSEIDEMVNTDGAQVGFSFLDIDGSPLVIDQQHPLIIPIPEGEQVGTKKIKVHFNGSVPCTMPNSSCSGIWRGESGKMSGFRVWSDDPDHTSGYAVWTVNAVATAPHLNVNPTSINFGSVGQGTTKTATVTLCNSGNAPLTINSLGFMTDQTGQKFHITTDHGNPPLMIPENTCVKVFVAYSPHNSSQDTDKLLIGSNDANTPNVEVDLTGGALCKLQVDPNDQLVFPTVAMHSSTPRPAMVTVRNIGYGDCNITRLDILGPGGDRMHPSVDDFSIMGCGSNPCNTPPAPTTLCAPSAPGCTASSVTYTAVYLNNDNSTTDLVELHIYSNDPFDPEHLLVMKAEDVPCFYPTPVITLETTEAHCNMPVWVNATNSAPGGSPTGMATITGYQWSWLFTAQAPPAITPPDQVRTMFVPTGQGVYILGLTVQNDCGAQSQSAGTEMIAVQCP